MPAERDEVRKRAGQRLRVHASGDGRTDACRCPRCVADRAVLRYVPPGDATDPAVTSAPSQAWGRAISVAACRRVPPREAQALASLGAPPASPTVPTLGVSAAPFAARLAEKYDERRALMDQHGDTPSGCMQRALISTAISIGIDPFAPTVAPPEVFAGVSEDDLCVQMLMAADPSIDPGVALTMVNGVHRAKVRAVLTRLKTTLVAPVDPEVVARRYHDHKESPVPEWPYAADHDINSPIGADHEQARLRATSAMRAALTAAGIPVTPEVGK